jgi:solute carrier family 25 carnitine/acylcarnitine transporter 20/29
MWRGQGVTSVREAVYGSLYFSVFEQLKRGAAWALDSPQVASRGTGTSQGLPFAVLLLCGGCTGAVVWTFMFPIDVVSRRPHVTCVLLSISSVQVKSKMQAARERRGPGAWGVAAQHWRAEGAAGFFKGWSAAMVRSLPAHAVVLATYTTIMQLLL